MKFILIDSREKPKAINHIKAAFDAAEIPHSVSKLYIGDYMDFNRPAVIVDRKQNIEELAKNCTSDHERFKRELERARAVRATLVILVEQNRYKSGDSWVQVESIEDLMLWSKTHKTKTGRDVTIRGEKVYRVLKSWVSRYDLRVEFCDKRSTGRRILEILYPERQK